MKGLKIIYIAAFLSSCTSKKIDVQNVSGSLISQSKLQQATINKRAERIRRYNDSLNTAKQWKLISGDLYINKDGDIGIIDAKQLIPPEDFITVYQYTFCDQNGTPLNTVIDVKALSFLQAAGGEHTIVIKIISTILLVPAAALIFQSLKKRTSQRSKF